MTHAAALPGALAALNLDAEKERLYASAYKALTEGDLTNAQRMFGLMAAMGTSDERVWIGLGTIREKKNDTQRAATVYQLGTVFAPSSVWCHLALGRTLGRLGQHNKALCALDKADELADNPQIQSAIDAVRAAL